MPGMSFGPQASFDLWGASRGLLGGQGIKLPMVWVIDIKS